MNQFQDSLNKLFVSIDQILKKFPVGGLVFIGNIPVKGLPEDVFPVVAENEVPCRIDIGDVPPDSFREKIRMGAFSVRDLKRSSLRRSAFSAFLIAVMSAIRTK